MAENIETLILDDSEFINPMKEAIKVMKEAEKGFKDLSDTQKKETEKVAESVKKSNDKQKKAIEDVTKKQAELRKETIENAKSFSIYGVSIGDITDKLKSWKNSLIGAKGIFSEMTQLTMTQKRGVIDLSAATGLSRNSVVALAKSFNVLKIALISTGIGAVLIALGGLISFLTSTQKGMDLVSEKTAYLGGAFDVLKGKLSEIGNSIVESFSNGTVITDLGNLIQENLTNRVTGLTDVFKNLWSVVTGGGKSLSDVGASLLQVTTGINAESIKETANEMLAVAAAAESIQKQLNALKREQAAYNVQFVTTRAEIERLKKIGDDVTTTFEARTNAVKKGASLEQSINAKNIEFLQREIGLTEKRIKLKGEQNITDADNNKVYELRQKLAEALNDSEGKQTELQNTLNGLIKEQRDLLSGISDNLIKIGREYNTISEQEEFEFVKAKQIEALEKFKMQLIDVGKTLGIDVNPQLKQLEDLLNGTKASEYVKIIDQIPTSLAKGLQSIQPKKPLDFKLKVNVDPDIDTGNFFDDINNFEDLLQKSLDELFGSFTDGEKAREFIGGATTLINEFGTILNEATDIQLSNIDKQLEQLSERRETLQDELEAELELQEKGLANNVGNKQQEVDGILAEEARLNTEKDKLQKEAAKRALVLETAQQAQSLITASIQIYKGFAGLPFGLGIPLAIAAIGSLFAFFAKTKVDAFKATKLYTGAEKISDHFGFGDRHGDTDLPGRGSGYRLVNQRTGLPSNVVISGKEMLLPESVSLPNSEFFHSLRNGMYNGIDLNAAMGFYLNYKGKVSKANQSTVVVSRNVPQVKERNKIAIPHVTKNGRKGMIITTIKDEWQDGKFIEIDF